jgi:integrase
VGGKYRSGPLLHVARPLGLAWPQAKPYWTRSQAAIRPFLKDDEEACLFNPRDAGAERHSERAQRRKTWRTTSELNRRRKRDPERRLGLRYTVNSSKEAVRQASRRAGVPVWSVLQVRHTRATEVRERFGVEGAPASLGNARVETAQTYAEKNRELARKTAREIGSFRAGPAQSRRALCRAS